MLLDNNSGPQHCPVLAEVGKPNKIDIIFRSRAGLEVSVVVWRSGGDEWMGRMRKLRPRHAHTLLAAYLFN